MNNQTIGVIACSQEQLEIFLNFLGLKKKQIVWINGSTSINGLTFDKVFFVGDYHKTPKYYDLLQEIRHRLKPECIVKYIREAV